MFQTMSNLGNFVFEKRYLSAKFVCSKQTLKYQNHLVILLPHSSCLPQVLASILYKAAREQSLVDPTKVEEILGVKDETAADPIADPEMTGM